MSKPIDTPRLFSVEDYGTAPAEDHVSIRQGADVSMRRPFSITLSSITEDQANKLLELHEGQFCDLKAIDIAPAKLSKAVSAFANSDGGDLYIGISDTDRQWKGFDNQEAANGHVQCFESLFPLGTYYTYEFLQCEGKQGLVLHVLVTKSKTITVATNKIPYIRRGAQNLPVDQPVQLKELEYNKGLSSFESEPIAVPLTLLTESPPLIAFMNDVVPKTEPETWLRKQLLIVNDRPTVAGVLLFAEEPQAALPKRSGIKLYRYKTSEKEGTRETLAFTPETIEGCLYAQIRTAVARTKELIEDIPRLGTDALEKVQYPEEALHEIITNAALHRDYSIADDVHIRIFDNRVEIESPGKLPAHITVDNILQERFARNGSIVRLLNKFPDPPNKDVGEGLNTAFSAMKTLGLKEPVIDQMDNAVLVTLKHEKLASPEEAIMDYLSVNDTIKNAQARVVTNIHSDQRVKKIFSRMVERGLIEQVPGTSRGTTAYRKKPATVPPRQ